MKVGLEQVKNGWTATLYNDKREYLSCGGDTPKEAMTWLVRAVNRMAMKAQDTIIAMGFLTVNEVDDVIDSLDEELHGKDPELLLVGAEPKP